MNNKKINKKRIYLDVEYALRETLNLAYLLYDTEDEALNNSSCLLRLLGEMYGLEPRLKVKRNPSREWLQNRQNATAIQLSLPAPMVALVYQKMADYRAYLGKYYSFSTTLRLMINQIVPDGNIYKGLKILRTSEEYGSEEEKYEVERRMNYTLKQIQVIRYLDGKNIQSPAAAIFPYRGPKYEK